MTNFPNDSEPQSLHELSWNYAQDGKVAVDAAAGIILDANPAMEALTGYSRAELIGMHVTMLHPEAERERVQDELRKATQLSAPHLGLYIQQRAGNCVPVAIWSSEVLKLAGRSITIVEFRDITVHNDDIKHLEQVEARYRGLMEAAPDGIVVVNQGGEIVLLNARAESQFGYSRNELLGQKVTTIIPEGFAERLIADEARNAAEALAQQIGTGIELNGLRKDGSSFPIEIMLSPLENDEGILVTATVRDITVKKEREHQLTAQNWALSAYAIAALALGKARSTESLLLKAICEAITNESAYVLAWIGIAEDGPNKDIRIAATAGSAVGYLDGLHLSWSEDAAWGKGPAGSCIRTSTLQFTDDTQTSPEFAHWRERAMQFGIRSTASIPLQMEGGRKGSLNVYASRPKSFEQSAIDVFQHLAEQIGRGMHAIEQERLLEAERKHSAKAEQQLTETLSAMVEPIVLAMEMRDPYTAGHQGRVADIAVAIGREMGWTEGQVQGLRVAAQVHDIGKISIPAEILTKPGKLNAAERALINQHSEIGYTILKDIPFAWPIAEIVHQHHEKMDGSGYPRGLKADELLPEAKILAVADIVEAMASYRPYRPGIPLDVVLKEIEKDAGTLLDPEVVRVCVSLFRDKHFMVPGWIRH